MHERERERDLRTMADIGEDNKIFYRIKFAEGSSKLNGFPWILVTPCYQNRAL